MSGVWGAPDDRNELTVQTVKHKFQPPVHITCKAVTIVLIKPRINRMRINHPGRCINMSWNMKIACRSQHMQTCISEGIDEAILLNHLILCLKLSHVFPTDALFLNPMVTFSLSIFQDTLVIVQLQGTHCWIFHRVTTSLQQPLDFTIKVHHSEDPEIMSEECMTPT